jgi:hypothetical protein
MEGLGLALAGKPGAWNRESAQSVEKVEAPVFLRQWFIRLPPKMLVLLCLRFFP